ncbi:unnamed protein product [Nippostrongylus brasiliensis]|uniref:PEST proteolytic signal-containing nuclear protein n=1 Tax=Nippostrongylus brasiliensis TaxID=27835 RepID=A0A0N4XWF3_NIPBR|nr:unnamed protein product [Nippostrongylus brasiliensis]
MTTGNSKPEPTTVERAEDVQETERQETGKVNGGMHQPRKASIVNPSTVKKTGAELRWESSMWSWCCVAQQEQLHLSLSSCASPVEYLN